MNDSRSLRIAALTTAAILGTVAQAWSVSFSTAFNDGFDNNWPGSPNYGQGFLPALTQNPDLTFSYGSTYPLGETVELKQFQFFKSGATPADGATNIRLAITNGLYANLQGLTTTNSTGSLVGLSTNTIASDADIAPGSPITFNFDGLPLRYGTSYGAVFVNVGPDPGDGSGATITPIPLRITIAQYAQQSDSSYHPITNYGRSANDFQGGPEMDYSLSTSYAFDGSYLGGDSLSADARFVANFIHIVPGDFSNDDLFTVADVQAAMSALSNLNSYMSTNDLSPSDLLTLGDFNHDGVFDNSDIQAMIGALANGGGSGTLSPVPEPGSAILLALGGLILIQCGWWQRSAAA